MECFWIHVVMLFPHLLLTGFADAFEVAVYFVYLEAVLLYFVDVWAFDVDVDDFVTVFAEEVVMKCCFVVVACFCARDGESLN